MPPLEMKTIAFPKPSLLELNQVATEDFDKAMIPNALLDKLKEASSDGNIAFILLPAFGFLYVAFNSKVHQYDANLLETNQRKFQILKDSNGVFQIAQSLEDEDAAAAKRLMSTGRNILFQFGNDGDESLKQAKDVAEQLKPLLGYLIEQA